MVGLFRLTGKLLALLPEASLEPLARLAAVLTFDLLRLRRRIILGNLQIAFGNERDQAELIRLGRASVVHFFLTFLEFFRSVSVDIARDIVVQGRHHLDEALGEGRGAYVLCCHLGNWEAMGAGFTRDLCPARVLVKKVGSGSFNRFVEEVRDHNGFLWVRRREKGDGYREIRRVLEQGEVVGFVIDQARPGEPRLPFFGEPAKTNTSLAAIRGKIPAPVVPSFIVRRRPGHHTLYVLPALDLKTTGDGEKDILAHSQIFNEVVESMVRRYPEQYFWMHNRWKA